MKKKTEKNLDLEKLKIRVEGLEIKNRIGFEEQELKILGYSRDKAVSVWLDCDTTKPRDFKYVVVDIFTPGRRVTDVIIKLLGGRICDAEYRNYIEPREGVTGFYYTKPTIEKEGFFRSAKLVWRFTEAPTGCKWRAI